MRAHSKNHFVNKILLSILSYALACNNDQVNYYNHEKWQWTTDVMGWWYYEHVHRNPVEVKEIFYDTRRNDRKNTFRELPAYSVRRFDKNGNLIFLKTVYADSTCFIKESRYDQNGEQSIEYVVNKAWRWGMDENDTNRVTYVLLPDGNFRVTKYNASGIQPNPLYSLISFSDNGKRVTEEELFPKLLTDTMGDLVAMRGFSDSLEVSSTITSEYDDDSHIQTYEYKNKRGDGSTYKYHYSKKDFLDSLQRYDNGKWKSTDHYVNNEFGDPVKIGDSSFEYEYDKNKNWIKRVAKHNSRTITVIREIKYAE